ncbi:MAG: ATP-binding cassette domain-containing protein [Nitrososphaerales archaeon]|nr:ATP-binding cassette domain-containing protein [Nitrososphaerales archaeon]
MLEVAIEMNDVEFAYPNGLKALNGVSLRIFEGEKVAILGPNGAGKSTLLMLINGLLKPSRGNVRVLGMSVEGKNLMKVREKVGFVFQNPDDQLFCPTVWEDVIFGPLNMRLSKEEVERRGNEALRAVGIENLKDRAPHHLSLGEKKKVAIATALAMQPQILVLDEPTANLDPLGCIELIEILDKLHRDRRFTSITATCDVNIAPLIADRVYLLNGGRIVAEGPLKEVFSNIKLMNDARLQPPTITKFFAKLMEVDLIDRNNNNKSLPTTIEEAVEEMVRLKKETKIKI